MKSSQEGAASCNSKQDEAGKSDKSNTETSCFRVGNIFTYLSLLSLEDGRKTCCFYFFVTVFVSSDYRLMQEKVLSWRSKRPYFKSK